MLCLCEQEWLHVLLYLAQCMSKPGKSLITLNSSEHFTCSRQFLLWFYSQVWLKQHFSCPHFMTGWAGVANQNGQDGWRHVEYTRADHTSDVRAALCRLNAPTPQQHSPSANKCFIFLTWSSRWGINPSFLLLFHHNRISQVFWCKISDHKLS